MIRRAWTLVALVVLTCGAAAGFAAEHESTEAEGEGEVVTAEELLAAKPGPEMSSEARIVGDPDHPAPPGEGAFGPDPVYDKPYDPEAQRLIYAGKQPIKTPQPIMLGRRLYDRGAYTARPTWLGEKNPLAAHLMAYGDLRVAAAYNDNGVPGGLRGETEQSTVAMRLNLDIDIKLTATERFHFFVRPFDKNNSFTRYDIDGKVEDTSTEEFDFNLETAYFEGDLGAITSGWSNKINSWDFPIALGLVPILTQNGVWIEDAFLGFAFALTAKNSPSLNIPNYDFTFFVGFDKVTTDAVRGEHDAELFGVASFMDFREGYLEWGYGYVHEDVEDFSYHNVTAAYSKRYAGKVSNSVRVIGNFGQSPVPGRRKTADGVLLLIENSWITGKPSTLIPYFNFFAGTDTPQSLARDAGSGGVLRNTGINFETDGVTGYPTLDARGHDAWGGAIGVEYLFGLKRQLIVEVAGLDRTGDLGKVLGSEYALGIRFQQPLSAAWILRLDAMAGSRDKPLNDISGFRIEIRRKI